MKFDFQTLDIETVQKISDWVYPDSGTGLYMDPYFDSWQKSPTELKGPGDCDGFGVFLNGELFGLFEFTFPDNEMEIGCAISPQFRGKGFGAAFVTTGINFGIQRYNYSGEKVLLTVGVSNKAAITVYKRAGFVIVKSDEQTLWMEKTIHYDSNHK